MYNYNELINKEILILQFPNGALGYSSGKIKEINNYQLTHLASTEPGSSGSPIFLKDNIKIIGIHKSGKCYNSENYGDFIGPIFKYFKNISKNKIELNKNKDIKIELNKEKSKEEINKTKNDNELKNISNNKLNKMPIIYDINENDNEIKKKYIK